MIDAQAIYRNYLLLQAFKKAMGGYTELNRKILECGLAVADSAGAIRQLDAAFLIIQ